MGLDTYAVTNTSYNKNTKFDLAPDDKFEGIVLCGGMFSGEGSSFRGKVYDDLVEKITDVSLYQDFIPQDTVKIMYDKMVEALELAILPDEDKEDLSILSRFFKVCVDNNYALHGWW